MRNKEFDLILNRMCRKFEENEFNPDEWSYGYDISLTFAFSEYFNSLEDYQIAEEFEDGDEDLEKTVAKKILQRTFKPPFNRKPQNSDEQLNGRNDL